MSLKKWILKKKKVDTFLQTPFLRTFFALPVPVFFRELHSKNSIGVYTLQVIIVEHFLKKRMSQKIILTFYLPSVSGYSFCCIFHCPFWKPSVTKSLNKTNVKRKCWDNILFLIACWVCDCSDMKQPVRWSWQVSDGILQNTSPCRDEHCKWCSHTRFGLHTPSQSSCASPHTSHSPSSCLACGYPCGSGGWSLLHLPGPQLPLVSVFCSRCPCTRREEQPNESPSDASLSGTVLASDTPSKGWMHSP